ncbi:MAG: hypothetical protein JKX76_11420 [Colwellia sp.]|nr:hypothetical protein [Colwellia sp.]
MALYSWFSKNNKSINKSVPANNSLLKAPKSSKYIENYTMWPTAKVIQGIEVKLPMCNGVENKLVEKCDKPKSTSVDKPMLLATALTSNK